jgi:hypothetical protein
VLKNAFFPRQEKLEKQCLLFVSDSQKKIKASESTIKAPILLS